MALASRFFDCSITADCRLESKQNLARSNAQCSPLLGS